jgi:alcohol dehydrogenase
VQEKLFRAVLAGFPNDVQLIESAAARLIRQRVCGELADAFALCGCRDIDPPDAAAEFFLLRVRIEVAPNEPDDLILIQNDTRPGCCRVDVGIGDRIRGWGHEGFLPAAQGKTVCGDDRFGRKFFQSQVSHVHRVTVVCFVLYSVRRIHSRVDNVRKDERVKITGAVLEDIGRARPFAKSRPLTISELELEDPGVDELLVKIEAAGVCHSDLSVVDGSRIRPVPMLLGHEAAGRVVALGAGVTDIVVGERVVMTFLPRCGQCAGCATDGRLPCEVGSAANNAGTLVGGGRRLSRDGQPISHHLGVSAFATHAVVNRHSVVRVDDDVPADVAAVLGCAVLTGGGAVLNAGRPALGEPVLVVGLGGVGMAALLTAIAEGHPVVGVDAVPAKLEEALALGASEVFTPAELADSGVTASVVVEAAGNARAFETAVSATSAGGTTVTVGLPAPTAMASISPLGLVAQARTIVGSYLGSAVPERDIPRYVALWRAGRLPVEKLISSRIALDDINYAMDELAAGHAIRQLIEL